MAIILKRRRAVYAQAVILLLIVVIVFLRTSESSRTDGIRRFSELWPEGTRIFKDNNDGETSEDEDDDDDVHYEKGNIDWGVRAVNSTLLAKARKYVGAIMDAESTDVDRMYCPPINTTRYDYLKVSRWTRKHKYFIAIDLRECIDLLPRLMGSVVEAIRFLGPRHVALSVIEGNSKDGTAAVLSLLKSELAALGVEYFPQTSDINPSQADRIHRLAQLRQLAVQPMVNSRNSTARRLRLPGSRLSFSDDATALFLNDVAICAEDVLELLHQKVVQKADMTCAMDWQVHLKGGDDQLPAFYDVWVSRGITGDLFFDIPENGSWDHAWKLFPTDNSTKARLDAHRPFQVFACWNGAVSFAAKPLLQGKVAFRGPKKDECFQGEVQLFCKDMWWNGYGKIAAVPSINLEYVDPKGREIKEIFGYASNWTSVENSEKNRQPLQIDWRGPPDEVKCMPTFDRQSWMPWNESLV